MNNNQQYSTIVRLNATEAKNQLDALTKKVQDLERARDKALSEGKDTKFVKELNKQLKQASAELKSYETNVKTTIDTLNNLSDATVGEIEKAIRAIRKEMKAVSDPTEYAKLNKHLESLKGRLADIRGEAKQGLPLFERMNNTFNKWQGSILAAAGALTGLTMTVRKAVSAYGDMEEKMADVRKYTGMSDEAVRDLNESLKAINTRTSREELNDLAGAAGRLGITSKDDILQFVDAADKIGIALGDDLGDGAVDKIGKLAMAFGEDEKKGLRGAMLATGSAINELAANSSANAGYLVEFSARLAGVGATFKMTQADIMGMGAVLDENMQQSEMSSTALSQTLMKLEANSSKFAKVAGKNLKEFGQLVKTDVNEALLQFLEGLKGMGDEKTVIKVLDDLQLDGTRAAGVLMALANKTDDIRRLQGLANDEYRKGSSVLNEYNTMNNTVNAQLDKNKKQFQEVIIELGEKLLPVVKYTISGFSLFAKTLLIVINVVSRNIVTFGAITAAIVAYTVAVNAATIKTKALAAIQATNAAATTLYTGVVKGLTAAKIALQMIMAKLEGNWAKQSSLMLDAQRAGTSLATGYGALIAIAITLGAAIYGLVQKWQQHREEMEKNNIALQAQKRAAKDMEDMSKSVANSTAEEISKITQLNKVINSNAYSIGTRRKAITEMQKVVKPYQASIDNEGRLHVATANAIKEHIQQLKDLAMAEAIYEKVKKLEGDRIEALLKLQRKQNNVKAVQAEIDSNPEKYNAVKDNSKTYTSATGQTYTITDISPTAENAQKHQELQLQKKAVIDAKREEETIGKEIETLIGMAKSNQTTWGKYTELTLSGGRSSGLGNVKTPKITSSGGVGNGSGGYVTDKERKEKEKADKAAAAEEKKRQAKLTKEQREAEAKQKKAAAEALKAKKEQEKEEINSFNEKLAQLKLDYSQGVKDRRTYLEEEYDIQMKHFDKMKQIWGADSEEYKKYADDIIKIKTAYEKRREEEGLPEIEKAHKLKMLKIKQSFYDEQSAAFHNQEVIDEALYMENIDYLEKKRNLYKEGAEKRIKLEEQIEEEEEKHKLDKAKAYDEKLQDYREKWGKIDREEQQKLELQGLDILYNQKLISEEEYQRMRLSIIAEYSRMAMDAEDSERQKSSYDVLSLARAALSHKNRSMASDEMDGAGIGGQVMRISATISNYKTMYEKIEQMRASDKISEEEASEAKKALWQETLANITSSAQAAYDGINNIVNAASQYAQACSEYEVAKITADYDKQIEAAGKNSKKKEALEKERDQKIRAEKTKANKQAMNIELAQAFASTALAAINAYSSAAKVPLVGHILGPIAAAAATAAGMLQIATIKKQHQTEQKGYYSGGFTGGRNYRREAGVVHEGEFVANHQAVNNRQIYPALSLIDQAQRNHTIGSLTAADVSAAMGQRTVVADNGQNEEVAAALVAVNVAVSRLNAELEKGIDAKVYTEGEYGIARGMEWHNKIYEGL